MQMLIPGDVIPCPIIDTHWTPVVCQNETAPTSNNFYLHGYIGVLQYLFNISFERTQQNLLSAMVVGWLIIRLEEIPAGALTPDVTLHLGNDSARGHAYRKRGERRHGSILGPKCWAKWGPEEGVGWPKPGISHARRRRGSDSSPRELPASSPLEESGPEKN